MHKVSTVRKGFIGLLLGLTIAAPGAGAAEQPVKNNCWMGALVFPPDKEFTALKTYQKVYANRLKSHPNDEKMAARLRVTEENIAKFLRGRTPAQKLFATGGALPITITAKTAFFAGEPLTMTVQSCAEHPIEGFCSKDTSQGLAGQTITTPIVGVGALAKDSVYGYLRLYVEPDFDGMQGHAFARVEYAGPMHWNPVPDREAPAYSCPE